MSSELQEQLKTYIQAGFSGLYIETSEPEEAQRDILSLIPENSKWQAVVWDVAKGVTCPFQSTAGQRDPKTTNPLYPLTVFGEQDFGKDAGLVLLHNYHRFLENPQVVQGLANAVLAGKSNRVFYLILSHIVDLPIEIEKLFTVVEHHLPRAEELLSLAADLQEKEVQKELPQGLVDAALGLTRRETESALALSLVKKSGHLDPEVVWDVKTQTIKKKGYLEVHRGKQGFDSLGGLTGLKDFSRRLLRPENRITTRGLLLLGPPGTGKSAFARALGRETNRPTLLLDIGSLYDKHVGETEHNIRQALKIADSMGKCILFVDEIEKALSGVGGEGDSGVATRLFGTLLTWLSDREQSGSQAFFIGTCNDISKLPPEFSRAERFDGVFFIDLPTEEERQAIWQMYVDAYQIPYEADAHKKATKSWYPVDDTNWTGAEIKACCRLAAALELPLAEAAKLIVPVALTADQKIRDLRNWAAGRCLDAAQPKIYELPSRTKTPAKRRNVAFGDSLKW